MNEVSYTFYKIPKKVFDNPNLSPCAKLLFAYLISREAFYVNKKGYSQGSFFHCYLRTLAKQVGRSTDSVRKNYIPELNAARYIEKKNIGGQERDKRSTKCMFRIVWENITNTHRTNENEQ